MGWGLTVDPHRNVQQTQQRSRIEAGRPASYLERFFSLDLSDAGLDTALSTFAAQSARSTTAVITLEPGEHLAEVADGRLDPRLKRIAATLATFRGPVALRFAHEMNGDWYPWSGDPTTYVAAWRHVHELVSAGAPDVRMVWAVNSEDRPSGNRFESYWPGRAYVEVLGVDGYNCLDGWRTPSAIFGDAIDRLRTLDRTAPLWITETASCESNAISGAPLHASKATWVEQLLELARSHDVSALIWFDRDKEYDWRIDTSSAASASLRSGLGQE